MPTSKTSKFTVTFGLVGQDSVKMTLKKGATLGDLKAAKNLEGLDVRLNGVRVNDDTLLNKGDAITATPMVKGGA